MSPSSCATLWPVLNSKGIKCYWQMSISLDYFRKNLYLEEFLFHFKGSLFMYLFILHLKISPHTSTLCFYCVALHEVLKWTYQSSWQIMVPEVRALHIAAVCNGKWHHGLALLSASARMLEVFVVTVLYLFCFVKSCAWLLISVCGCSYNLFCNVFSTASYDCCWI